MISSSGEMLHATAPAEPRMAALYGWFRSSVVYQRRAVVIGVHLLMIPLAFLCALNLRFEFAVPNDFRELAQYTLLLVVVIRMTTFAFFGLFHGWWRHAGMHDLLSIAKAVTVSSVLIALALYVSGVLPGFPRSVLMLDWLLALFVMSGARLSARVAREEHISRRRGTNGTPTRARIARIAA